MAGGQHPIQTRSVATVERGVRMHHVQLDGSAVAGGTATTNGILLGSRHLTVTENGDGDYTFTLNDPGERILGAHCIAFGATDSVCRVAAKTLSTIQIVQTDLAGAALADEDFLMTLIISTAADES